MNDHETAYRQVFERSRDALFIVDEEGRYREVNAAALSLTGYSREELLAMRVMDLLASEMRPGAEERLRTLLAQGGGVQETKIRTKTGEVLTIELSVSRITYQGKPALLGAAREIGWRRETEARLAWLNRMLRTISTINQLIVRAETPQQLLTEACHRLVEAGRYRLVWIGLIAEGDPVVRPVAVAGEVPEYVEEIEVRWDLSPLGHGPTGTAIRTGQPSLFSDFIRDPRAAPWWEAARRHHLASALSLPIRRRDRTWGALTVYADHPHAFDDEEVALLHELAGDLGLALDHLEAVEAQQQYIARLETLHEVDHAILAARSPQEIAQAVLTHIRRLVPCDRASLLLFDFLAGEAEVMTVDVNGVTELDAGLRIPLQKIHALETLQARQVYQVTDLAAQELLSPTERQLMAEGVRSLLVFPLTARGHLLGSLNLGRKEPRAFTARQLDIIREMGDHLAVALENLQLYEDERKARLMAEALHEATAAVSSTLDFEEVLDRILEQVSRVVPNDVANVMLVEGDWVRVVRWRGYERFGVEEIVASATFSLTRTTNMRWMLETRQPMVIPDTTRYPGWVCLPGMEWLRSYAAAPICLRERVLGFLNVDSATPGFFTIAHARRLQAFANQVAIALENARLYQELRQYSTHLEEMVQERTQALRDQQARVQAILDAAGESIFFTDREGTILYANPATTRLTGYALEEIVGQTWQLWQDDQDAQTRRKAMWETLRQGHLWRGETVNRRKDGTYYDALLTLAPIQDERGEITGFVGVQQEITHLKELDRLRTQLISNVSHELRTPLTNLKLYLRLLEQGKPDRRADYLETLHREADRLHRLIEDLLYLSRLELEGEEVHLRPMDLNRLVQVLVEDRTMLTGQKGLVLRMELQEPLPLVLGDERLLGQVLTNLLTNAMRYTPSGGEIILGTALVEQEGERWVTVSVTDTGLGIPSEELPHLFERFFRGEAARQTGAPGTGLGLAICQEIADRHGGRITVQSRPGEGSTFTVWLRPA